ncbi:FHA domain-containing protein [Cryptosporangium sp. NPDC048952]|uniref:FHA domain-containing protein n=1 Tax=Cryptosporangium sp. NPDC048952 TaxID=3363961 RepID=UPI003714AD36
MTRLRLVFTNRRTGAVTEHTGDLPLTVGRDATQSDVALDDRSVSRRHVRLDLDGGDLVVTDLDSSNGTFVNGSWIRAHVLRPGDRLGIGSSNVEWTLVETPEALTDETRIGAGMTMLAPFLPPTPTRRVSPARRIVEAAEKYNKTHGHELDGFLSIEHGFLPVEPPLQELPASHRAWDDLVDRLPALYANLGLRAEFDRLPILDADADALPERYLLRASALLGVFAHAYQYGQTAPPDALPPSILRPWQQVSRRLGKDVPSVSYIDLFFYNWKLRDPDGPRRLANLELLVPAWRNRAEEIFYLVTTEFAMELTPMLGAMLSAQDAVLADDRDAVEAALLTMLERLQHVTQTIYPQIDPNPRSANHLDLVLWAKTVGTSGVPIFDGAPSPAGTAQPQIHALDAFFGRKSYHSTVGRQSLQLRAQMPRHWRELIEALNQVSVSEYVRDRPDLRGLYAAVLDAYIGDRGWMGLHRIKAYGFLEVAFKVGRSVTTGAKFTGLFRDKTWEAIDQELGEVRDERWPAGNQQVYFGRVRRGVTTTDPDSSAWTTHLRLDVAGQGIRYQPGDRLGVLPENDDALVRATLRALRATGDELVRLTTDWQEAIRFRAGFEDGAEVLPLRTLLTFGRIRPVGRTTAKRLLAIAGTGALARIVSARMEDQWELWDVLDLVRTAGYDVTRLWSAPPDEADSICRLVPPEVFRLYSIASAASGPAEAAASGPAEAAASGPAEAAASGPAEAAATGPAEAAATGAAETIDLVVGGLTYTSPHTTVSYERRRTGSASHFLRRMTSDVRYRDKRLSLTIVPTPRFRLPADPSTPVVMFAAGSGVAPFHGFAQARADAPGTNWLFLGLRRPDDFVHPEDFARLAAAGRLHLRAAFSQADNTVLYDVDSEAFVVVKGVRQRVDRLMTAEAEGLRAAVDSGAHLYVCGSAGFAGSVLSTLQKLDVDVRELIARGRLGLDIFTTYRGHAQQGRQYDISTVIERNSAEAGHWMVVSGKVYDVSEFIHLHVGGPQIIRHYVGMDATSAYQGVLHHQASEVDAQLSTYELGHMRRLDFGDRWGVVLGADGLRFAGLEELFTAWVRYVYLVVSMENALVNDYGFAGAQATAGSEPADLTPFKLQFLIEAHRRFLASYLEGLVGEDLTALWRMTVGFCAPSQDVRELRTVRRAPAVRVSPRDSDAERAVREFAAADQGVLRAVKTALRDGIRAFEEHEADVIERGGQRLLGAIEAVFDAVDDYYRRIAALGLPEGEELPIPPDRGVPGHGTPHSGSVSATSSGST